MLISQAGHREAGCDSGVEAAERGNVEFGLGRGVGSGEICKAVVWRRRKP